MLPTLLVLSLLAGIPVDGRVHDLAGVGLAGARVELRPILSRHEQGLRELEGRPVEPAARALTGPDGRFKLLAPDTGMWEITVAADGFVPRRFRLTPLTEARSLPPVELRRDAGLRIRIVSPAGRPIPGARVSGRPWKGEDSEWRTVPRMATTGSDGVARLACSRDEVLWLFATAPGFPVQEGPEARGPAEVAIGLQAGTPRRVEVRGPDGALVRDLRTSLVLGRTRNGRAEVAVLAGDEPWLALETADGVSVRFAVGPAGGNKARVTIPAPAPLPGRVIDASTRQPLADAWVWPQDDPARFVRTGADGGYRLPRVPDSGLGAAAVRFLAETAGTDVPWPADRLPTLALDPAPRIAPTTTVDQGGGGSVAGRIASPDGSPVVDGEVEIRSGQLKLGPSGLGAEGRFAFADVPPGWYEILVRRPGALAQRLPRFQVRESGGETELGTLVLRPEDLLTGRVETFGGQPVAGAEVWAESLSWGDPVRESWPAAVSGPDGSFTLRASAWEEIQLTVCRPGFLPIQESLPRFYPEETLALVLEPAATLAGRITGPDGSPLAGGAVYQKLLGDAPWVPGCAGADWRHADGAGRFRVDSLAPGYYDIGSERVTLVAGETREAAILYEGRGPAKTALSGRLLDETGSPVPGTLISVEVHKPKGETYLVWYDSARTDGDGNYRFEISEPEVTLHSYGLSRNGAPIVLFGLTPWPGPETLRGEVSYDLTVKQRPRPTDSQKPARPEPVGGSVTLAGRILGVPPETLPRATLMASENGVDGVAGSIDVRGTYRLDGLKPGKWWIRLTADGGQFFDTFHIPAGETRIDRDLIMGPLVEAEGVVETPDHEEDIAGANVSFRHFALPYEMRLPVIRTRTRKDGTFSIRLPRGEYSINASRPGFLTPAWVNPGWTETVEENRAIPKFLRVPLEHTARLSGTLRGLPADEDVKIEATRVDQEGYQVPLTGKMDTETSYSITGLGPGTWDIVATYELFGREERKATGRVEIPETPVDARLDLAFRQ